VKEGVRSAIALAMDLPDRLGADDATTIREVEWENKADAGAGWDFAGFTVRLRLGEVVARGDDETRYEYDPDTDRNVPTYSGYRSFTVRVTVKAWTQADDAEAVGELSSRLRTRMRADRVLALLEEVNVAFVGVERTVNMDNLEINGRSMSIAVTDVRLGMTETWTDEDEESGHYIKHVELKGYVKTDPDDVVPPEAEPPEIDLTVAAPDA
jgi:hypothetical protein